MILGERQINDVDKCELMTCSECSCTGNSITTCQGTNIQNLIDTLIHYIHTIKRLQYGNLTFEGAECPLCGGNKVDGHKNECEVGKILDGGKNDTKY